MLRMEAGSGGNRDAYTARVEGGARVTLLEGVARPGFRAHDHARQAEARRARGEPERERATRGGRWLACTKTRWHVVRQPPQ